MTAALAAVDRGELRSGGTETFASYPIPALGHRRLTAISPGHLRKLVADLAASNSLASKTINNAVVPLRLMLAHAVEDGLIPSNPAAATAGGLAGLLLASGLRIGEALALQWSDVALEHGAIIVRRALKDGGLVGSTKADRARRVEIGPRMAGILADHRARCAEHRDDALPIAFPAGGAVTSTGRTSPTAGTRRRCARPGFGPRCESTTCATPRPRRGSGPDVPSSTCSASWDTRTSRPPCATTANRSAGTSKMPWRAPRPPSGRPRLPSSSSLRGVPAVIQSRSVVAPLAPDDPRVAEPILTPREAAWNLDVPESTFRAWAHGYVRAAGEGETRAEPLLTTIPGRGRAASVPFVGLAEGLVLAAFRQSGVPLQRIRPALKRLSQEIGLDHALASRSLFSDGAEVLYDYAATQADAQVGEELTVVRSGQRVFRPAVQDYLKLITFGGDGWPAVLRLPAYRGAYVVIDPSRGFGLPLFEHGGARVEDVMDRWRAGESFAQLSADYGVPAEEIEDAARTAAGRAAA